MVYNGEAAKGGADMVQRICPICDQVMKSAHYCKNCRSWVKHPYIRDAAYFLNERHPQDETGCSYHDIDSQRVLKAEHKAMSQPAKLPVTPKTKASPDGVWKPIGLPPLSPAPKGGRGGKNTGMGGEGHPRTGSSAVIGLFLVAAAVSLIGSFSGPMLDAVRGIMAPPVEYDIDLGDYTGEETESNYRELDEADVIARGERCNTRGHFDVMGKVLEQPLLDILKNEGLAVVRQDTYSYNEAYDNGETWYTTWTSIEVAGEKEDGYQYVELDFDTGTGELHEISLSLDDSERLTEITGQILRLLADQGEIDAGADCFGRVEAELPAALKGGAGYNLLEGAVLIEGISYENTYAVYISHNIDSDL